MKKIFVLLLIFFNFTALFAFEIDFWEGQDFSLGYDGQFRVWVADKSLYFIYWLGFENADIFCYQIQKIDEIKYQGNGWCRLTIFGEPFYCIFGGGYFTEHCISEPTWSMYYKDFDFTKVAPKWKTRNVHFKNGNDNPLKATDYLDGVESIEFPDYLTERIKDKEIKYDGKDMLVYTTYYWDGWGPMCNADAKPWATGKNPIGMKIKVNFFENTESIHILNGYVDPNKPNLYKANRRVKKIKVSSPETDFEIVRDIEDVVHFEKITLPKGVRTVEIEILEFYEGEKYTDTCIQFIGKGYFTRRNFSVPFYTFNAIQKEEWLHKNKVWNNDVIVKPIQFEKEDLKN